MTWLKKASLIWKRKGGSWTSGIFTIVADWPMDTGKSYSEYQLMINDDWEDTFPTLWQAKERAEQRWAEKQTGGNEHGI